MHPLLSEISGALAFTAVTAEFIAVVVGMVALLVVVFLVRRRRSPPVVQQVDLTVSLSDLDVDPLLQGGTQLTFYGVPVRLAVLVLAPAGRGAALPEDSQLPGIIDQLVPGMMAVLNEHRPTFRRWPPQLSRHGFVQSFFQHVRLPGDHGKETPWCSVAGRFEAGGNKYLVGIVCHAGSSNNLSQVAVEHVGRWMDVLRVENRKS